VRLSPHATLAAARQGAWELRFRVSGLGFRVWISRLRECRVHVPGVRFRIKDLRSKIRNEI
jgi:hypothetical protein